MANRERGEVTLKAGDETYTLRLSINAIVEIETLLDAGVNEISAMIGDTKNFRLGPWRAVLWGALRQHHPEVDLFGAGDIIGTAGVEAVVAALGEAMSLAFPPAGPAENPQRASPKAGTSS